MKLAIIGYGKMGKLIEEVAVSRGHHISCIIDVDSVDKFSSKEFRESDVAIEFSTPGSAVDGILASFAAKVPIVVGTTGWTNALPAIEDMCRKGEGTLLFSSNFSIGMNIFMAMNRYVAKIMDGFAAYRPSLCETHHIHKLDHPSGTAITLASQLTDIVGRLKCWVEAGFGDKVDPEFMPVYHRREGEVPGIHTVTWDSDYDTITFTHDAKNRLGFVNGAVSAAEWLCGRKGYFTIGDFLSDVTNTSGLFEA